jgi:peptidoglycan/LPS O-acetylase OafA/YrhL
MTQADRHYRPDIDGLRAIAVGAVLIYHAFPSRLPGGFVGVDVFFVISGYLISGIILDGKADGRFTFGNFYARRIRRIFPALAALLIAVLAAGWLLLYAEDYTRLGRHVAAGAAFLSNIAFWREASYFDVAADLKPLLHLWSLGVEEQFYLVWPVLLVMAARWRRGPLAMTFVIGTISFLLAIWTVRIDRTPAFYAPWNRFWELLAGATLACIEADAALHALLQKLVSNKWFANGAAAAGAIAIAAGVWLIHSTRVFPGLWVMLPVGGTFLLIVAGNRAWINNAILSRPAVVFIGLISYPLYLWHWPLLSFAHIVGGRIPSAAMRLSLLGASVALAVATYYLLERPIRFGVRRRAIVPALVIAVSIACAAGVAIVKAGGFMDRPINRSNAARLVGYYEHLHNYGLSEAYRSECDVMEWDTQRVRTELDPSCVAPGPSHTIFLWGDSYAQALTRGLSESLPPGTSLAQVTTSACRPQIEDFDLSVKDRRCEVANLYAMEIIGRLRPDLVIVAQEWGHAETDWPALIARVLALGAKHVAIVGPSPVWRPSLPRVYAEQHLDDRAEYVRDGLDLERFDADRIAAERIKPVGNATYVSLLDQLCRDHACLARVPGEDDLDLFAVDAGHLSPKASSYLGRAIWKPYLDRAIR